MSVSLLVIDVQNDFCEGGALAARHTNSLLATLNDFLREWEKRHLLSFLTRDWHPPNHRSFVEQGGPWPRHCVRGTRGAQFAEGLYIPADSLVIDKGVAPNDDGYSMFENTNLPGLLAERGANRLVVCGIAAEYCVLESVRDARRLAYDVTLLEDLIRPINATPGDGESALTEMREMGAKLLYAEQWWQD